LRPSATRQWNATATYELTRTLAEKADLDSFFSTKQSGTNFMIIRGILISAILLSASSTAFAQQSGTAEQRAACAPDVRRFCHKVKESDGSDAFLQCFELHRDDLSKRCSDMLKEYGK
jgi:hypothetical protein